MNKSSYNVERKAAIQKSVQFSHRDVQLAPDIGMGTFARLYDCYRIASEKSFLGTWGVLPLYSHESSHVYPLGFGSPLAFCALIRWALIPHLP